MAIIKGRGLVLVGGGRYWGGNGEEDEHCANNVYTCMQMQKMIPVETISRIRGRGMKGSSGGGEFKYNIFDIL
jgi:hypothetical protein